MRCASAACAFAVVGMLAGVSTAHASRTIYATTKKVERIGDWRIAHHPTFRAAIRAYGEPNSFGSLFGSWHCRARWWALGLRVDFANLGGQDPCRPRHGLAGSVKIKGRPAKRYAWRTWKGLDIGDSLHQLRQRHPSADRRGRNWWIKTGRTHIGTCPPRGCRVPILKAITRHKRVRAFFMTIGAAGD